MLALCARQEGQTAVKRSPNHVLDSLSKSDAALLRPSLQSVALERRDQLEQSGRSIEYAYFPEDGIVSVVADAGREFSIEVGIVGQDSMTAHAVVMNTDRCITATFVQVKGYGQRIRTDDLQRAFRASASLRLTMLPVVQAFYVQTSRTALANGRATIEQRLARWLLMAHDRLDGDSLDLTHEFLAVMLGVQRPGVTVALNDLVVQELISMDRRLIQIQNRGGLVKLATKIYGASEAEQTRLTGWKSIKN
jgi:CRP-like cAMP-binding protein